MGLADVVGSAKVKADKAEYLTVGNYPLLQVTFLKEYDKDGKLLFFANLDVLESVGDDAIAAGSPAVLCVDCVKYDNAFAGDVKKFLGAVTGMDPEKLDTSDVADALDPEQPLKGMVVACVATPKPLKSDPTKFVTLTKFTPAGEGAAERAVQRRLELGLAAL